MTEPRRHRPARRPIDNVGNRSNLVFVTVCTSHRKPILAAPNIHELLLDIWSDTSHWIVGRYVVMPDHIHLFCAPAGPEAVNVRDWVAYWKSKSARTWPRAEDKPIWQREAWDRQLRKGESYSAKWAYVLNNPVRHGLAASAEDWPYKGELCTLPWHDI